MEYYHEKTHKWFVLETCDNCGNEVLGANTVTTSHRPANTVLSDDLPHQELVYSDELEMNTCETCQAVHQALRQLGKI